MLVGLRWWTTVDDDGKEKWYFESYDFDFTSDSGSPGKIFWPAQFFYTVFWLTILVFKIITFTILWVSLFVRLLE